MFGDLDGEETVLGSLFLWVVVFHDKQRGNISIQSDAALVASLSLVSVEVDAGLGLVVGAQHTPPTLSPSLHLRWKIIIGNLRSVFTTKRKSLEWLYSVHTFAWF